MNPTIRQDYMQTLDEIATVLPPNRLEQLVKFARLLEAQILSESLLQEESMAEIEADNEKWDALLETDEGQTLLEKLANEALAEHQAGKTRPMAFNNELEFCDKTGQKAQCTLKNEQRQHNKPAKSGIG
jgi:hypothetical protein